MHSTPAAGNSKHFISRSGSATGAGEAVSAGTDLSFCINQRIRIRTSTVPVIERTGWIYAYDHASGIVILQTEVEGQRGSDFDVVCASSLAEVQVLVSGERAPVAARRLMPISIDSVRENEASLIHQRANDLHRASAHSTTTHLVQTSAHGFSDPAILAVYESSSLRNTSTLSPPANDGVVDVLNTITLGGQSTTTAIVSDFIDSIALQTDSPSPSQKSAETNQATATESITPSATVSQTPSECDMEAFPALTPGDIADNSLFIAPIASDSTKKDSDSDDNDEEKQTSLAKSAKTKNKRRKSKAAKKSQRKESSGTIAAAEDDFDQILQDDRIRYEKTGPKDDAAPTDGPLYKAVPIAKYGEILIATKDIAAGEIIVEEKPEFHVSYSTATNDRARLFLIAFFKLSKQRQLRLRDQFAPLLCKIDREYARSDEQSKIIDAFKRHPATSILRRAVDFETVLAIGKRFAGFSSDHSYETLMPIYARFFPSCTPNVHSIRSADKSSVQIRSTANIVAGDVLSIWPDPKNSFTQMSGDPLRSQIRVAHTGPLFRDCPCIRCEADRLCAVLCPECRDTHLRSWGYMSGLGRDWVRKDLDGSGEQTGYMAPTAGQDAFGAGGRWKRETLLKNCDAKHRFDALWVCDKCHMSAKMQDPEMKSSRDAVEDATKIWMMNVVDRRMNRLKDPASFANDAFEDFMMKRAGFLGTRNWMIHLGLQALLIQRTREFSSFPLRYGTDMGGVWILRALNWQLRWFRDAGVMPRLGPQLIAATAFPLLQQSNTRTEAVELLREAYELSAQYYGESSALHLLVKRLLDHGALRISSTIDNLLFSRQPDTDVREAHLKNIRKIGLI